MSEQSTEQADLRRARAVAQRSLALYDRLGEAWDNLLEPEQIALVEEAERLAAKNDEE